MRLKSAFNALDKVLAFNGIVVKMKDLEVREFVQSMTTFRRALNDYPFPSPALSRLKCRNLRRLRLV